MGNFRKYFILLIVGWLGWTNVRADTEQRQSSSLLDTGKFFSDFVRYIAVPPFSSFTIQDPYQDVESNYLENRDLVL